MRIWAGEVECAWDVWSSVLELEEGSILLSCVDGETVGCCWAEGGL